MLSQLRHLFIDSWFGRVLVGLIFIVFVGWGVSDIFMNIWNNGFNDPNVVAWAGKRKVATSELDNIARQQIMNYASQQGITDPSQIPSNVSRMLVTGTLSELLAQNITIEQAQKFGITVPDDTIRQVVFANPAFQKDGQFNRDQFNAILQRNNISEGNYLNRIREQLTLDALINPVQEGGYAADTLVKPFFQFEGQTRTLSYVKVPFSHFQPSAIPAEPVLKRYYANHLPEFTLPEFRRVRLIILSPETIAKDMEISDQTIKQYYEARKDQFNTLESRSFQLVTFPTQQAAQSLMTLWQTTGNWQQVQDFAHKNNGTAIEMTDLAQAAIPLPELAKAVFDAGLNQVMTPIQTPTGWDVIRVTEIIPAKHRDLAAVKDQLRDEIARDQAAQLLGDRIRKIQDILAGGNGFDKIPAGLGVAAIEGTLNEQGLTQEGEPAPIPAQDQFRQNMLGKIFSTAKNAQPVLIQGDNNAYYAFIVENILPAHEEGFEQAKNKVIQSWQKNDVQRKANIAATAIYKEVTLQKKSLHDANSGFVVQETQPFSRGRPIKDIPFSVMQQAFAMKKGETTMVEVPDGFMVADLTSIVTPEKKDAPDHYQDIKGILTDSVSKDIHDAYVMALQKKNKSQVNQKVLDMLINQLTHQ